MAEFGADQKQDAINLAHHLMDMLKSKPGAPNMRLVHRKKTWDTCGTSASPARGYRLRSG